MKKKIDTDNSIDKITQKLESFIEPKNDMENKKYSFWTQLGMGIKWVLISIGIVIVLIALTEVIKILK